MSLSAPDNASIGSEPWYLDWLYGGVSHSIPGNGGQDCVDYLPHGTRVFETIFIIVLSLIEVVWACSKLTFEGDSKDQDEKTSSSEFHLATDRAPVELNCVVTSVKKADEEEKSRDPWPPAKRFLLVLLCMEFGVEIGYKLATRTMIYVLNPCHMLSLAQIYLLASDHQKKCKTLNTVFRIHLYLLNGVLLAMIFPVLNTRFLTFETSSYWMQHLLIYLIPVYLISLGGSYSPDPLKDMRWPILSIGCGFLYHFIVLQSLAMVTQTNLNNMLCPAVSDPFEGLHYRKFATVHQHLMIIVHQKIYHLLAGTLTRIISAVHWFCVAVTLKMWRLTIHLCWASARLYVRVWTRRYSNEKMENVEEFVQKKKMS